MVQRHIDALLDAGLRSSKPRTSGLTIMIDKGQMGPHAIADFATVAGDYCDYAKIAWGSALITGHIEKKLELYRQAKITPMLGGTLFEYAFLRGKVPELLALVRALKVHLEISDGVIELPRAEKLRWIGEFAKHVEVFSEVGGKIVRQDRAWTQVIQEELKAGSYKVVIEGREIGPTGMTKEQDVRGEFVDLVCAAADPKQLIFEAFERRQQTWLIKRFGPEVNLANIPPTDVLTVESFRRGLKEHTLLHTWESLASLKTIEAPAPRTAHLRREP